MNNAYVEGFVKQCEAMGVDPEELAKSAVALGRLSGLGGRLLGRLKRFGQGYASGALRPGVGLLNTQLPGAERLAKAVGVGSDAALQGLGRSGLGGFIAGQATLPAAAIAGTTALASGGISAAKRGKSTKTAQMVGSQQQRQGLANMFQGAGSALPGGVGQLAAGAGSVAGGGGFRAGMRNAGVGARKQVAQGARQFGAGTADNFSQFGRGVANVASRTPIARAATAAGNYAGSR